MKRRLILSCFPRELARTMDSVGWNFFGEFMAKVDAFNKERESKFSDAGFKLASGVEK